MFSACVTNEYGPVKALKCQLPFKFAGREFGECSTTRTPSAKDPECKDIWRKHTSIYPKKPGEVLSVDSGDNKTVKVKGKGFRKIFHIQLQDINF